MLIIVGTLFALNKVFNGKNNNNNLGLNRYDNFSGHVKFKGQRAKRPSDFEICKKYSYALNLLQSLMLTALRYRTHMGISN